MIFGRETEHGSVIDLRDLRDGPDFIASCLDVEAWEEELEADPSFALRASEGTGEEAIKDAG